MRRTVIRPSRALPRVPDRALGDQRQSNGDGQLTWKPSAQSRTIGSPPSPSMTTENVAGSPVSGESVSPLPSGAVTRIVPVLHCPG